jgi:hypothetical protein
MSLEVPARAETTPIIQFTACIIKKSKMYYCSIRVTPCFRKSSKRPSSTSIRKKSTQPENIAVTCKHGFSIRKQRIASAAMYVELRKII